MADGTFFARERAMPGRMQCVFFAGVERPRPGQRWLSRKNEMIIGPSMTVPAVHVLNVLSCDSDVAVGVELPLCWQSICSSFRSVTLPHFHRVIRRRRLPPWLARGGRKGRKTEKRKSYTYARVPSKIRSGRRFERNEMG